MIDSGCVLKCSICGTSWNLRQLFLDPELVVNGYQAALRDPMKGLILLTHQREGCNTTLALRVRELIAFADQRDLPLMAGTELCPGHCQEEGDLESCSLSCCMAWVRELLLNLRNHTLPTQLVSDRNSPVQQPEESV